MRVVADRGEGAGPGCARPAGPGDAGALRDLERAANLVALRHVFDPAEHSFPDDAVLRRWQDTLAEPGVRTWLVEGRDGDGPAGAVAPVAVVAHDERYVRHLAVHPRHWGRGLGSVLLAGAVEAIRATGAEPRLWCLRRNPRAYGLYLRRGWRTTGTEREAVWPPHPVEVELRLPVGAVAGSGG